MNANLKFAAPRTGFDFVLLRTGNHERRLTKEDFDRLPLGDRLACLMDTYTTFYRDGFIINARDATRR